ncbi:MULTISPECIES: alanine dehydrogenase [unclassified Brevibacterium]|uniref:alanine dehydrogenase n=1 Tax=unclassified Brevibacterium TaxID=2614124 RepID=UPI0010927F38|nr:alanine dehydrogenase [Brevibacterium sp. S22]TGD32208.1 alanine dehydrogenase [Brevibacterium sp. S22]
MRISVPTEVKNNEFRVAITAAGVHELVAHGHEVTVQAGAGEGSFITDAEYETAGAKVAPDAAATWAAGDLVLKVKEPIASEYGFLRKDLVLFTYLHLAADEALTKALMNAGTTAIAYETVAPDGGGLPLLAPMSEIAGRLSTQVGAHSLLKAEGGRGILLSGVPGVERANVVVIGAGVAGTNAARMALGLGANVEVIDINIPRLRQIDETFAGAIATKVSNKYEITKSLAAADLVIGSVLIPGKKAPKLVTDEMVARMKPGSVLVDIAIDQGGCFENSRPTTHDDPTFTVHNSVYYCVANMPGAVPNTATAALTNATLPFAVKIADQGWHQALLNDSALARGLNVHNGHVTNDNVAEAFGFEAVSVAHALAN